MRLLGKTWLAIFIAANYFGSAKSSRTSDKAHSFFEHVTDQGFAAGVCRRRDGQLVARFVCAPFLVYRISHVLTVAVNCVVLHSLMQIAFGMMSCART